MANFPSAATAFVADHQQTDSIPLLPGTHPNRHELQPGARISILSNLTHRQTAKIQAYKVTATVDSILGEPYQSATDTKRHPFAVSTWFIDVCLRDVQYTGKAATEYEPLDPSRVVLRLDKPQARNRWRGYWWLLQAASNQVTTAVAEEPTHNQQQQQEEDETQMPASSATTSNGPLLSPAQEVAKPLLTETTDALQLLISRPGVSADPMQATAATVAESPRISTAAAGIEAAAGTEAVGASAATAAASTSTVASAPGSCSTGEQQQQQQGSQAEQMNEQEESSAPHLPKQQQQPVMEPWISDCDQVEANVAMHHHHNAQPAGEDSSCNSEAQLAAAAAAVAAHIVSLAMKKTNTSYGVANAVAARYAAAAEATVPTVMTAGAAVADTAEQLQQGTASTAADNQLPGVTASAKELPLPVANTCLPQQQQQQQNAYVSRRSRAFKKALPDDVIGVSSSNSSKARSKLHSSKQATGSNRGVKFASEQHRLAGMQVEVVEQRLRERKRCWQQHMDGGSDGEWEGLAAALAASVKDMQCTQQQQQQQQQQAETKMHSLSSKTIAGKAAAAAAGVSNKLPVLKQQAKRVKVEVPQLMPQHQPQQQQQQRSSCHVAVEAGRPRVHQGSKSKAGVAAQYRGVYWNFNRYRPQVHIKCGVVRLGGWDSADAAARAYDLAALVLAQMSDKTPKMLNFPLREYEGCKLLDISSLTDDQRTDSKYLGELLRTWLVAAVPKVMATAAAAHGDSSSTPAGAAATADTQCNQQQQQQQQRWQQKPCGRPRKPLPAWGTRKVRSNHWMGRSDATRLAAAAAAGLAALAAAGIPPNATSRQVAAVQAAAVTSRRRSRQAAAAPTKPSAAAAAAGASDHQQQVYSSMTGVIRQLKQHVINVGSSLMQLQDSMASGPPTHTAAAAAAAVMQPSSSSSSTTMTPAVHDVLQKCMQQRSQLESSLNAMLDILAPLLPTASAAFLRQQQQQQDDTAQVGNTLLALHAQTQQQLQQLVELIGPLSTAVLEAVSAAPAVADTAAAAVVLARAEWVAAIRESLTGVRDSVMAATQLLGS